MNSNETADKHPVILTEGQYTALDRLTSGNPEYQTDRTKSLRRELDRVMYQGRGRRYHVRFTSQDLESAVYVLQARSLRNGRLHLNRLLRDYKHLMGSFGV